MNVDKVSIQNKRASNQDSYLALSKGDDIFLGVFDGIGGLHDGDKASQALRDALKESISTGYSIKSIIKAIQDVSSDIFDPDNRSGTTIAFTIFNRVTRNLVVISSGDSRIYASAHEDPTIDTFQQLTIDDTVANLRPDKILPGNKAKSTLVYSIGVKLVPHVRVQTYHIASKTLAILAATDGFWHTFEAAQIAGDRASLSVQEMVDLAVSSGETDNITGVLGVAL